MLSFKSILISISLTFFVGCAANQSLTKASPSEIQLVAKHVVNDLCATLPAASTVAITIETLTGDAVAVPVTKLAATAASTGCTTIYASTQNNGTSDTVAEPVVPHTGTLDVSNIK